MSRHRPRGTVTLIRSTRFGCVALNIHSGGACGRQVVADLLCRRHHALVAGGCKIERVQRALDCVYEAPGSGSWAAQEMP